MKEDINKVELNSDDATVNCTEEEYFALIEKHSRHVFDVMRERGTSDVDMRRLHDALMFAGEAHRKQKRNTGAPYIIHPISVATIAAEELKLDVNSVICAFLHDVVEDTKHTVKEIRERFGDDVAFLVNVVTKKKRSHYDMSKQVDNYKQLLDSLDYDIRALMVKIADRLHNMRTLSSMSPDKQMKIAGETDYFYAPLANRLGLFNVKTDLENLAFKYRCAKEYNDLETAIAIDEEQNRDRLHVFCSTIEEKLRMNDVWAKAEVYYRKPYSIYRKMKSQGKDFMHIDNRYYVRVTFTHCGEVLSEKNVCLLIYSLLTDIYKEKPLSFVNQIDQQKENSYQSLNLMLLSEEGVWEDVQICSDRMVEASKLGCMAERDESNVGEWIDRFKKFLHEIADSSHESSFMESIATSLYYDDVMVFTPRGKAIVLPNGATAIDFAFELHTDIGLHAKYARINGKLCSVKTVLKRGDCIEIGMGDELMVKNDWLEATSTYKARRAVRNSVSDHPHLHFIRCPHCNPLPGCEAVGFKDSDSRITIHRRSCPDAIHEASSHSDRIVTVDFEEDASMVYPVAIHLTGVDRYHLLIDITNTITENFHLLIISLNTAASDNIVDCTIKFFVHGVDELKEVLTQLYRVEGVDEVHTIKGNGEL